MSAKEIRKKALSTAAKRLKRAFDVLVALCGLLVFSPAFVVLYFVIRHEDGGPAIFRQERIGRGGRPFMLYKFRSMTVTAEKDGPALYVKGDMSVVGYRPERQFFVEKIMAVNPDYERLYEMRPGLFSSATLYNGYTDTLEKMLERLRMDLEYLENWNL